MLGAGATCLLGYSCWTFPWCLVRPPCASSRCFECFANALLKLPDNCSCLLQHQTQLLLTTCTKISVKHYTQALREGLQPGPCRDWCKHSTLLRGLLRLVQIFLCWIVKMLLHFAVLLGELPLCCLPWNGNIRLDMWFPSSGRIFSVFTSIISSVGWADIMKKKRWRWWQRKRHRH